MGFEPFTAQTRHQSHHEPDANLIQLVMARDGQAFRGLFDRHAALANGLAFRIVRQSQLAEDIVQEAFLAVWQEPQRYDPSRGSVRSWLMGIVHHRAVDTVRREQAHRRRAEKAAASEIDVDPDPMDEVVSALTLDAEAPRLREALSRLPQSQREVIERMYFDGFSQTHIAEATGVPLGTVKSRTLLGMRRLRVQMEAWPAAPGHPGGRLEGNVGV